MRYTKQPITIKEQLTILKQRGLCIDDDDEAVKTLKAINYFRLAGYWRHMEDDRQTHQFKTGSTFSQVLDFYNFDTELKALLFTAIQRIEIAVRTQIIQHFSLRHGAFWFMDAALAEDSGLFQSNLESLKAELSRSQDEFILEHFRKYDSPDMPPSWKTLEVASFGTLSKLYRNMRDNHVKKQVAREYGLPHHEYMHNWLRCLTVLRNVCAHHARMWNSHYVVKPKIPNRLPLLWIQDMAFHRDRLYPLMCIITYWLNAIDTRNTFAADFKALLVKYPILKSA